MACLLHRCIIYANEKSGKYEAARCLQCCKRHTNLRKAITGKGYPFPARTQNPSHTYPMQYVNWEINPVESCLASIIIREVEFRIPVESFDVWVSQALRTALPPIPFLDAGDSVPSDCRGLFYLHEFSYSRWSMEVCLILCLQNGARFATLQTSYQHNESKAGEPSGSPPSVRPEIH